jgi:hypothetical protein
MKRKANQRQEEESNDRKRTPLVISFGQRPKRTVCKAYSLSAIISSLSLSLCFCLCLFLFPSLSMANRSNYTRTSSCSLASFLFFSLVSLSLFPPLLMDSFVLSCSRPIIQLRMYEVEQERAGTHSHCWRTASK